MKELNTFLGFVGYYRGFIPEFIILTNKLNVQKKSKQLEWTEQMERKFLEFKSKFKENLTPVYPEYEGESFELTTDFSSHNLGAVLSQMQQSK